MLETNDSRAVSWTDQDHQCIDCAGAARPAFVRSPGDANYVTRVTPAISFAGSGFVVLHCRECGSIFLDPDHAEDAARVYSEPRYFSGYYPRNIHTGGGPPDERDLSALRTRLMTVRARRILRAAGIRPPARVFEVGSAMGHLLEAMERIGCEATGIEISDQARLAAKRGLRVVHARMEEAELPENSFDLAYANQVFEHIFDLGSLLKAIRQALRRDGRLVIVVPNDLSGYRPRLFRGIWWMIPPIHVRYFTERSLATVFQRHGFELESLRTEGVIGEDIAAVYRWYLRSKGLGRLVDTRVENLFRVLFARVATAPLDAALSLLGGHTNYLAVYRCA